MRLIADWAPWENRSVNFFGTRIMCKNDYIVWMFLLPGSRRFFAWILYKIDTARQWCVAQALNKVYIVCVPDWCCGRLVVAVLFGRRLAFPQLACRPPIPTEHKLQYHRNLRPEENNVSRVTISPGVVHVYRTGLLVLGNHLIEYELSGKYDSGCGMAICLTREHRKEM